MKKFPALSLLVAVLCAGTLSFSLPLEDYELIVKKPKTSKVGQQTLWELPVTLINNTKDTLHYRSMSCSWQDIYTIDSKDLTIEPAICDKNVPVVISLAPGQGRTVELRLLSNAAASQPVNFRVGINILKNSKAGDNNLDNTKELLVWSNLISN